MNSYLDALELSLPAQTEAGKIRQQVLGDLSWAPTPTTMVSYVSSNRILIIADESLARQIEAQLPEKMQTYLALLATESSVSNISNAWNAPQIRIQGYLGRFEAFIDSQSPNQANNDQDNLGLLLNIANGLFDQVIDCSKQPLIGAAIKPPGYYHISGVGPALENSIAQLSELIGEFEKPRFFDYDPDICAHGRSGIKGCTRCIDACPTQAIISTGEMVQVNPYLCQGGGSCASSCPSGAISYTYPKAEEKIELLRVMLQAFRHQNENQAICLLIYDNEFGRDAFAQILPILPEHIIPFMVEEIGSVGLDLLSSALAYGANQVYLYLVSDISDQVSKVVRRNTALLLNVVDELKLDHYQLVTISDLQQLQSLQPSSTIIEKVATFSPIGNKRNTIRSALTHLKTISVEQPDCISLPTGSLFGKINLDNQACTLCMACVSVCPGKALQDGDDSPALKFIEANCLQCSICVNACPESAIELEARIHFEHNLTHSPRTLKEEQPFRCVKCGKPFAVRSMIEKMTAKLEGHWMFEKPGAFNRLKMCEDCRIIDVLEKGDMT